MARVFSSGGQAATSSAVQPADIPLPGEDAGSDGIRSGAATPAPAAAGAGAGVAGPSSGGGEDIPVIYVSFRSG